MTIFDNALTGYRFVDTRHGDTLQVIAYRELGDATQWPLLIAYNKLVYPFITDDPAQATAGVVLTGSQILVPAPVPVIQSTTDPAKVFEVDAALDVNGLLQADENGDLAVVSGVDNLDQALSNRVETDNGELIWHPEYGTLVRQLLGSINGPNAGLLAANYNSAAVLLDPRVQSVDKSVVNIAVDSIDVEMEVLPIVGRSVLLSTSL
jgi:phage baseplate assembly protein W